MFKQISTLTPTNLRLSLHVPHFSDEGPEDDNDQGHSCCTNNAYGENKCEVASIGLSRKAGYRRETRNSQASCPKKYTNTLQWQNNSCNDHPNMNVSEISSGFINPGMEWKHDSPEQDHNVKDPEHMIN